jgi:HAD superfamily hydrolase (TIGR01509 family)
MATKARLDELVGVVAVMQRSLLNLTYKNSFLFDLDGTLVDSNGCHERAYLAALALAGVQLSKDFSYESYKGVRTRDVFIDLGIEDDQLLTRLTEAKQRLYRDGVRNGDVDLIKGADQVLKLLHERKRRMFLVTGASKPSTDAVLRRLEIFHFFEEIITGDDVERSKPAPDCYLKCLERAELSPAESIAIEDALAGVESAQAAGLDVLILNNPSLSQMPEYVGSFSELHNALS